MITEDITNQFPPVYARLLLSCGKTYPVKSSYSKESYPLIGGGFREEISLIYEATCDYGIKKGFKKHILTKFPSGYTND